GVPEGWLGMAPRKPQRECAVKRTQYRGKNARTRARYRPQRLAQWPASAAPRFVGQETPPPSTPSCDLKPLEHSFEPAPEPLRVVLASLGGAHVRKIGFAARQLGPAIVIADCGLRIADFRTDRTGRMIARGGSRASCCAAIVAHRLVGQLEVVIQGA